MEQNENILSLSFELLKKKLSLNKILLVLNKKNLFHLTELAGLEYLKIQDKLQITLRCNAGVPGNTLAVNKTSLSTF